MTPSSARLSANTRRRRTDRRPLSPDGGPSSRASKADLCEVQCLHADSVERARAALPDVDTLERAAALLRVLGDPTRLRIVRALATEELCVCDIAALVGASQSAVSHSLRALRLTRLVRYRKVGKIAYYSVDDAHVERIVRLVLTHASEEAAR